MPLKFKFEDFVDNLGLPTKTVLGVTGALALGLPKGIGTAIALKLLYKFVTNRKTQLAFKKAASQRINPQSLIQAFEQFDESIEEEEPQQEFGRSLPDAKAEKKGVWVLE